MEDRKTGQPKVNVRALNEFITTKLEAYKGRGKGDPLESRDIEDILNLFDGRKELMDELKSSPPVLQSYIAEQIQQLLEHKDFDYAVQSTALGDQNRQALIFKRLEAIAAIVAK